MAKVDADWFADAARTGVGLADTMHLWRGAAYADLDGWPEADAARVRLDERPSVSTP